MADALAERQAKIKAQMRRTGGELKPVEFSDPHAGHSDAGEAFDRLPPVEIEGSDLPPPPEVDYVPEPVPLAAYEQAAEAKSERSEPRRTVVLTSADSIEPARVHWLWTGRLAVGTLGLLAGREGLGKSTFAYWLTARITRGQLDGEHHGEARPVLVCATEDSWAHTIVPRLIAADADLALVHRVEVTADGFHVGLSVPRDLHELGRAAEQTGAAMLLLDPLMSRLDGALDSHKDAEVRRALEPLVAFADEWHLAVLGLIHLNKGGAVDVLDRVMGSKAFAAVARSVSVVTLDPDDETDTRRLFGTPKNNLGRTDLPSIVFTVQGAEVDTSEGPTTTGTVALLGESATTVQDAVRRSGEDSEVRTAVGEAVDWLADFLHDVAKPASSKDVKAAAKAAGISEDALKRARRKLGVEVEPRGFPRVTYWSLSAVGAQSGDQSWGDHPTALTHPTGQSGQSVQSGGVSRDEHPTDDEGLPF
ncbi:MAG: AAA family ATPase [Actinobacteria bacterium]|nr:AAA family ATPase [Actinomycetota bacterium]